MAGNELWVNPTAGTMQRECLLRTGMWSAWP